VVVLANVGAATPDVLPYTRDPHLKEVKAPADARPLVVLPGFGNNTTDYTAPFGDTSLALTTHLEARHRTSSSGSALSVSSPGGQLKSTRKRRDCARYPATVDEQPTQQRLRWN
jgi:hypothetical protein